MAWFCLGAVSLFSWSRVKSCPVYDPLAAWCLLHCGKVIWKNCQHSFELKPMFCKKILKYLETFFCF